MSDLVAVLRALPEALGKARVQLDHGMPLMPSVAHSLLDAASLLSGLVEVCPDCEGTGLEPDHGKGWFCDGDCCPSCRGRGMRFQPEVLDRMREAAEDNGFLWDQTSAELELWAALGDER